MNASSNAPIVSLRSVRRDGGTQIRAGLSEDHVTELVEALARGDALPAVVAFVDPDDTIWLADGFHRAEAWSRAGVERVPAVLLRGTREDAEWYACGANAGHGLRRTNLDKQRAVERALRLKGAGQSDRQIARHCGVHQDTVGEARGRMEADCRIPTVTTRTGADGRTINVANIGAHPPPTVITAPAPVDESLKSVDPDLTASAPRSAAGAAPLAPPAQPSPDTDNIPADRLTPIEWAALAADAPMLDALREGICQGCGRKFGDDLDDFRRGACRSCHRKLGEAGASVGPDLRAIRVLRARVEEFVERPQGYVDAFCALMPADARDRLERALAKARGK